MKNSLKVLALVSTAFFAQSALAADLTCNLNVKQGGHVMGNGTAHCFGMDFSFGNSTSGSYNINNISKPISSVLWNGNANCSGGTSCGVTVRAYSSNQASATILYKDGTWETTNTARMEYETGH
jgi:hypothetical protein